MRVAIGSDHHGIGTRAAIRERLTAEGHTITDMGTDSDEAVDYPDIAAAVAGQVHSQQADRGVLICGSGIGMSIAANKLAGVRAAAVHTPELAELCRRHNDLNVLCLSDEMVDRETNLNLVHLFISTGFDGGRHQRRIDKISQLETR